MISSCEAVTFPVAAHKTCSNELRPAVKSCAEEENFVYGLSTSCQEELSRARSISPCRARICHSPTLAWKVPMELPRRAWSEILLMASAAYRKRVMESSLSSGNSEKIRYWLLNSENRVAINAMV